MKRTALQASRGISLIEVLVTIVILALGLLGMAGLQARALTAELESYQRGQAIILMQDMVDRMLSNAADAGNYLTTADNPTYLGTGVNDIADCTGGGLLSRAAVDKCEWSKAIKGSSETQGSTKQGAMINGRGCITESATPNVYIVTIVWQGSASTSTPSSTCGQNLYDSESTRRAISTTVRVPALSAS